MAVDDRPIRIVHITGRLSISGPSVHVILLTAYQRASGYDAHLIAGKNPSPDDDLRDYAAHSGVTAREVARIDSALTPLRDLYALRVLARTLREIAPDVVHTHTTKAGFIGRWAARIAGVPVVVHTFHSHIFSGYFGPLLTRLLIWMERQAARRTDSIITLTEGLRRELAETYRITRKGRIAVLPLGLDLQRFADMPRRTGAFRAAYGIPPEVPLVGIVGRLMPVKNHALFLEAAARIRARLPDARFAIVGDGSTRELLEAQVEALHLHDAVVFTGWLDDMPPVYSDFDVSVISSIYEGTPVPVIESLAAGCPVVATQVGGLPDLLEGGRLGRMVPPDNAGALADAILDTLAHPPDMTEPQATMLDRYGIARLIHDLDSLYRGLLAKKRRT